MGVISSGVLAGLAKVGLVVVAVGGLSAGAYFAYQVGPGGDGGTSVQIEPTLAIASPTAAGTTPTATVEPAIRQPTPLALDTSTWERHESLDGFELKRPPAWTLQLNASGRHTRLLNPTYQAILDEANADGQEDTEFPPEAGMAWFSVIPDITPGFDPERLASSCDRAVEATTLLGRAAVLCQGSSLIDPTLETLGWTYWVEFPAGHTMLVAGAVVRRTGGGFDATARADEATIEAIFGTFSFSSE